MNEEYEEEICVNCGAVINGNYRHCPFCGEIWYVRVFEQGEDTDGRE